MRTLNILHITDVHYGDTQHMPSSGHVKAGNISARMVPEARYGTCREEVVRYLSENKTLFKIDMVAFTGDLGWQGKKLYLERGIDLINKIARTLDVPAGNVFLAPGNHDLRRRGAPRESMRTFESLCRGKGFKMAIRRTPAFGVIKRIPIICLNSCLGAQETTLQNFSESETRQIKRALKSLPISTTRLEDGGLGDIDMDIPLLGRTQMNRLEDYLQAHNSAFFLILMHHNPIPTPNIEVRPYNSLIDSGAVINRLLAKNVNIILLHGHSHLDSIISVTGSDAEPGAIASTGSAGLMYANRSFSIVRLIVGDRRSELIGAIIIRHQYRGTVWQQAEVRAIWNYKIRKRTQIDLNRLDFHRRYYLRELHQLLEIPIDELLKDLVDLRNKGEIEITRLDKIPEEWGIERNSNEV